MLRKGAFFWGQLQHLRVYTFEYDLMGNRTYMEKTLNETVVEWHRYEYNESNQLISEKLYNGKKTTSLAYTYDADGNRGILTEL